MFLNDVTNQDENQVIVESLLGPLYIFYNSIQIDWLLKDLHYSCLCLVSNAKGEGHFNGCEKNIKAIVLVLKIGLEG